MWAGNVPSDATHVELWRFFNNQKDDSAILVTSQSSSAPEGENSFSSGVMSIFLISRSSCAFINFDTEGNLHAAIARYNGRPLRSGDTRCPRLVCRVRRRDDDLKAGVGAQRGMGMHSRWVKDQKGKSRISTENLETMFRSDDPLASPSSASDRLSHAVSSLSVSSDEEGLLRERPKHSSSSGSYASTNSSLLTRYFPQRYFILKSLTQVCGVWLWY